MVFFDDEQVATFRAGAVNSALDRPVEIWNKAKAAAAARSDDHGQRVSETERGARRIRAPRFAMALPAWIWFIFFFSIPVLWIVYYSFGYKPDIFNTIATDKLSFDRTAKRSPATFLQVFRQTLQISLLGTTLSSLIGFPFAYWLATRVSARWRGVLLGLVIVPFFVNFLVRTIGWLILLSPGGPVRRSCRDGAPRRTAPPVADARSRAAGRRLQLPGAHDLPAVRRARPVGPGMREARKTSAPAAGRRSDR